MVTWAATTAIVVPSLPGPPEHPRENIILLERDLCMGAHALSQEPELTAQRACDERIRANHADLDRAVDEAMPAYRRDVLEYWLRLVLTLVGVFLLPVIVGLLLQAAYQIGLWVWRGFGSREA